MAIAISIRNASKSFGQIRALQNIDLEIACGEIFGLLGPNGAGKTTLISAMAGLLRLDSGSISVMGNDVQGQYRQARQSLGVVPQELVFDPFFTVREALRLQSGYFGIASNDDWIEHLLEKLDLAGKADSNMRTLSGGMKRRVLVAQALVHRPPVIVLDEPTAGVDVELRQTLWQFVRQLNDDGHTIVLTTHYLEEAQSLCGRIGMLKGGKVVALDSTSDLLSQHSVHVLRIRSDRAPPDSIAGVEHDAGGWWQIPFNTYGEVENILSLCRAHGCAVADIEIGKPDLETVFVRIMGRFWGTHVNTSGFSALLYKEVIRFGKVGFQTLAAPILTAVLYLLVFSHALEAHVQVHGVSYTAFLIPGLVMMSVLQNAFANSSSSVIQSKITGNIVFVLLSPISYVEFFSAYVLASVVRGLAVGIGVLLTTSWFAPLQFSHPVLILLFAILGAAIMGSLGLIAGVWAEKFDQLAAFQNFLIMPLTFLSGVFYSIHSLPEVWQTISRWNPVFYMIDGFRAGFFGVSDVSPWTSLMTNLCVFVVLSFVTLALLKSGYKLRA